MPTKIALDLEEPKGVKIPDQPRAVHLDMSVSEIKFMNYIQFEPDLRGSIKKKLFCLWTDFRENFYLDVKLYSETFLSA